MSRPARLAGMGGSCAESSARLRLTLVHGTNLTTRVICLTLAVKMAANDPQIGDVSIWTPNGVRDSGFLWLAAGYAVHDRRVLLVLHNVFQKWVPPGGHVEPGETLAQTALREFQEETGLAAEVISAAPTLHPPDDNARPVPTPFYVDLEREGFRKPAIVSFFYMRLSDPSSLATAIWQQQELDGMQLFAEVTLRKVSTFEQVRSLSRHAIHHHPQPTES